MDFLPKIDFSDKRSYLIGGGSPTLDWRWRSVDSSAFLSPFCPFTSSAFPCVRDIVGFLHLSLELRYPSNCQGEISQRSTGATLLKAHWWIHYLIRNPWWSSLIKRCLNHQTNCWKELRGWLMVGKTAGWANSVEKVRSCCWGSQQSWFDFVFSYSQI